MGGTTEALRPTGQRAFSLEKQKMEQGRRNTVPSQPSSFSMFLLRLWMWAVPIIMLAVAAFFAVYAATDERWGLFVVMIVMGWLAIGLLVLHWWVLYRFGSKAGGD